jgi:methyl acetate hydrolase
LLLVGSPTTTIDRALRDAVRAGRVPGIVAAVTDRRGIVYQGAFGLAQSALRDAMQVDSVFRIASVTKVVTSLAVLRLVERGAVDVEAPFKTYFPEFRQPPVLRSFSPQSREFVAAPAAHDITVRELLTHTSGYGYWFLNEELRALTAAEPEFYNPPFLMHEPGQRFQYGVSTDVLGQLIAPVTGLTLAAFLDRELLKPLGMVDTGFDVPRAAPRLAALHSLVPGGFNETPNERRGEPPRGGGGLYSTAADLLSLLRMLLNEGRVGGERLLRPQTVAALATNQVGGLDVPRQRTALPRRSDDFLFMDGSQKFGFGVLVETRAKPGGRAAGSYAWAGIYNTYFWVDPSAGIAAVVLMQVSPFSAPVCIDVCDRFERAVYHELVARRR